MKKKYMNPTVEIVKVELQHMIATSASFGEGQQDGEDAAAPEFLFDSNFPL